MKEMLIENIGTSRVLIGSKINLSDEIYGYDKILLLSDENVFPLYGESVIKELSEKNKSIFKAVLNAGENSKSLEEAVKIVRILSENSFTREDLLVTLGGGVVSDLGGFVSSIYKRGINLCHVPTTILGAVDASLGGKTGVNTDFGKNILGTFYNSLNTIIDVDYFKTLPQREVLCGKAEILKYAFIGGAQILDFMESNDLKNTVINCVKTKKYFIERDMFDKKERMMLNFGHTVGHAIEKCSNYKISHGEAVSIGMATMSRYFGVSEIEDILKKYNLPVYYYSKCDELMNFIKLDKKRFGDIYSAVVPLKLGKCEIRKLSERQILEILKRVNE